MTWRVSTSHTERFAQGMDAETLRARAYHLEKGERITLQYLMVKDCADGSHRVLDMVIIAGNDRKLKLPTARAVIITGKRPALAHGGTYKVSPVEAIDYLPVCALHLRAELAGAESQPKKTPGSRGHGPLNKGAANAVRVAVENLAHRAHKKNLWLPTMAKRNLRAPHFDNGLLPAMKYYGVRDSWRVPLNKADDYRRALRERAEFTRSAAGAFEKVETLPEVL